MVAAYQASHALPQALALGVAEEGDMLRVHVSVGPVTREHLLPRK